MNHDAIELANRIRDELEHIRVVIERAKKGMKLAGYSNDDIYLDGVALNLHCFYDGLERLFELIAMRVDNSKPNDAEWHKTLLLQMAEDKSPIRPAVLSQECCKELQASPKRRLSSINT